MTGGALAFVIILYIALIPGFLTAHLLLSIVLDRQPYLDLDIQYPPITLLMAAYNEEENLPETFRGIRELEYPADIEIIVVDDGSTDGTVDVLHSFDLPNLKIIQASHGGKAHALNEGLKVRRNCVGLIMFMVIYQFIMSPTCVVGYTRELLGFAKRW